MRALSESTVVITGAGNGIGRALAQGFLADGARVVGTDVDEEGLEVIAAEGAITERTDVSSDADVRAMIERAHDETGRVDVVINNAGYGSNCLLEDHADGDFEQLVAVHLFGTFYSMRAAIPIMREQSHGRFINVVSRAAETGGKWVSAYAAAKASMWAASRSAASELEGTGILVNMLFPGPTNTAIWGRDMPGMQTPDVVYPTAKMIATLPDDGPTGEVFYREALYQMFDPSNEERLAAEFEEIRRRRSEEAAAAEGSG